MILAGSFLYPHFVKIPPWAKRSSSRGRTTPAAGWEKSAHDLRKKQSNISNSSSPKKIQPATATAVLSFFFLSVSILSLILSSLLLAYGSVFAPCQKAFQKFYFSKKERYFFYLFFAGFPLFFHSFFHSSSQDIPVRERPFSV